eukprot:TRINITY_DN11656_c0_g1_i2.p1 TRINITY_DN11656_c0_g1~~TRINITY_DN11656_c0_g1_i2.p1  ORF type:complete len:160 (-),score=19.76 TRINITY_DN11656_c0_g1_i2:58-537(-)
MFFPDPDKGFREMRRVLKQSGTAIITTWAAPALNPVIMTLYDTMDQIQGNTAKPTTSPANQNFALSNPSLFQARLKSAGFNDVSIESRQHEFQPQSKLTPNAFFTACALNSVRHLLSPHQTLLFKQTYPQVFQKAFPGQEKVYATALVATASKYLLVED